jgi:protein kinase-like protein/uncharacterized protein DUF1566
MMIGEILGNVRITAEIGPGKMGMVYMGEHVNVGKRFAVRSIPPQFAQSQQYREFITKAAKAQFQLKHENVVQFFDVVEKDEGLFLVMEYVEGRSLAEIMEEGGALPEKQALSISKDVLSGLNFAHSNGIIHRDIQPSNILVTKEGRAKIMNFGIGLMPDGTRLSETDDTTLAARYVSPEQITGTKKVDRLSDVYSMGILLYEMLAGHAPFEGSMDSEVYEKHMQEEPPDLKSVGAGVPKTLNNIVMRALKKEPMERFKGCGDFVKFLKAYESGDEKKVAKDEAEEGAPGEDLDEAGGKPPKKKIPKKILILAAAGLAVLAIGLVITMQVVKSSRIKGEYDKLMDRVTAERELEVKMKLLKGYVNTHGRDDYTERAEKSIKEIGGYLERRDYKIALQHADIARLSKSHEEAESSYKRYLKKHPRGSHAGEIKKRLADVLKIMEERDFKAMVALPEDDFNARIKAYNAYLARYASGTHRKDVEQKISEISELYYAYLKERIKECDEQEVWDSCLKLCTNYMNSLKDSPRAAEVKELRAGIFKRFQEKGELAGLVQRVEKEAKNPTKAKEMYLTFLKDHPDSTVYLKERIGREIGRAEKWEEWQRLLAYAGSRQQDVFARIGKVRAYIRKNPSGAHVGDAKGLLKRLQKEAQAFKRQQSAIAAQKQEAVKKNEWEEMKAHTKDLDLSVFKRIEALKAYMAENPSGRYTADAVAAMTRLRAEEKEWHRMEGIRKELSSRLKKMGGDVFVDKGDGMVLDKRTGLTWCLLDSKDTLNKCLKYKEAVKYVKELRTGGKREWRLPTGRELALIYKKEPFFPTTGERRYWTSDTRGKASWMKVHIVTSKKDRTYSVDYITSGKCETVRAVSK